MREVIYLILIPVVAVLCFASMGALLFVEMGIMQVMIWIAVAIATPFIWVYDACRGFPEQKAAKAQAERVAQREAEQQAKRAAELAAIHENKRNRRAMHKAMWADTHEGYDHENLIDAQWESSHWYAMTWEQMDNYEYPTTDPG
jgi:hypothetical protein